MRAAVALRARLRPNVKAKWVRATGSLSERPNSKATSHQRLDANLAARSCRGLMEAESALRQARPLDAT